MRLPIFAVVMTVLLSPAGAMAGTLDCSGPVTSGMSAKVLLSRFGRDAETANIPGAEGMTSKAVVLYPRDAARRLEISYWDDAQTAVSQVTAGAGATGWTGPAGLHVGSPLADIAAANGKIVIVGGFDWDYGGYVANLLNGKLSKLDGGCVVRMRLALPAGMKHPSREITGEKMIASNNAVLQASGATIRELSIGWPLPPGVRPSRDGTTR